MKYATRINSYLGEGKTLEKTFKEIGSIKGLDYVDMNYPEHFKDNSIEEIKGYLADSGLKINAINLRFRDDFINGDLGNLDESIKDKAIMISKEAVRVCEELDGAQIIFWLGHDGNDYSFQLDYLKSWNQIRDILKEISKSTDKMVSIEYKPFEERSVALIDSFGSSMLLVNDVNEDNFGVTADFCHILMKKENPAFVVSMLLERDKLFNMHLNDGHGYFDDGLMVGSVNLWITLEVMYYLKKYDFKGAIYFDTFPKREPSLEETKVNMEMCLLLEDIIERVTLEKFQQVIDKNDAIAANMLMIDILKEKN